MSIKLVGIRLLIKKDLTQVVDDLTRAGVLVMLSNSNTERIRDLYSRYHVQVVKAARSISADGNREKVEEVIVTNYGLINQ